MFKEIQKLFSLERLETLYLVAARSDTIDARRSRYDATTYQDWFLILPFLSFTTIQFRYQTRQNSPCPAVSKNILYWYFSRYSVLFLFSMMTVSSVNPGQIHSEVHCCPWHRRRLHSRFRCTLRTPLFSVSFRSQPLVSVGFFSRCREKCWPLPLSHLTLFFLFFSSLHFIE